MLDTLQIPLFKNPYQAWREGSVASCACRSLLSTAFNSSMSGDYRHTSDLHLQLRIEGSSLSRPSQAWTDTYNSRCTHVRLKNVLKCRFSLSVASGPGFEGMSVSSEPRLAPFSKLQMSFSCTRWTHIMGQILA